MSEVIHWWQRGACKGLSTDVFDTEHEFFDLEIAKDACGRCPVRAICLQVCIKDKEYKNLLVWGGGTPSQIARIARFTYHGKQPLSCERCGTDRDLVKVLDNGWRYCCK